MIRRKFLALMAACLIAACSPLDLIPLDVIGIPGVKVSELSEDELGPVSNEAVQFFLDAVKQKDSTSSALVAM